MRSLQRVFIGCSAVLALGLTTTACAPGKPAAAPLPGDFTLVDEANQPAPLDGLLAKSPHTVLLFFTAECPVQKAHDERMRQTVAKYTGKGVAFYAVQSEAGTDIAAERDEAKKRQIGMPLLQDRNAKLADALGVEYSTHVVVLESNRVVKYSGAEDSERVHMTDHATAYLDDALDAVLAGKDPTTTKAEPLGCPLRKH